MTDGKITRIDRIGIDDIFSIEGKAIAGGIIYGDMFKPTVTVIKSGSTNNMQYTTDNACYLDINLSVLESDSSPSPLELGIDSNGSFTKIC